MEFTTRKPEYYKRIIEEGVMEDLTEWIIEQFHPSRVVPEADDGDKVYAQEVYEYALGLEEDKDYERIIDLINVYLKDMKRTMLDLDHEDCERPLVFREGIFSEN